MCPWPRLGLLPSINRMPRLSFADFAYCSGTRCRLSHNVSPRYAQHSPKVYWLRKFPGTLVAAAADPKRTKRMLPKV